MKSISLSIFACVLLLHSIDGHSQKLTVVIKNIRDDKGNIGAALYNSDETFMKTVWQGRHTKARIGEVQLVFEKVPAGTYAISVLHDANENNKMDSNMVGMPQEGFGFSNDAKGMFGPPSFEKAKFLCNGKDQTISITLKYF
jgi:uncharacterized protein (DUF2141 family)